jgi:tetratricopeptide (TPR) repeat protein
MKLVQKILSHGLLIAFVVAAFFLYINRTELFPRWFTGASVASVDSDAGQNVAAADVPPATKVTRPLPEKTLVRKPAEPLPGKPDEESAPAEPAEDQSAGQAAAVPEEEAGPGVVTDDGAQSADTEHNWAVPQQGLEQPSYRPLDEDDRQEQPEPAEAAEQPIAEEGGASSSVHTEDGVLETAAGQAEPAAEDVGADSPGAGGDDGSQQGEAAASPTDTADQSPAEASSVIGERTTDFTHQLEQARSLYWQKQLEAAASAYEALAREYADKAELWGEIGNFYYSLGRNEQAAEAYSRAIELFARDGEKERARQLLEGLYGLDAQKARELETKVR